MLSISYLIYLLSIYLILSYLILSYLSYLIYLILPILSIYLIYLSYLSLCLSLCLSICPSIYLSIYLSSSPSDFLSTVIISPPLQLPCQKCQPWYRCFHFKKILNCLPPLIFVPKHICTRLTILTGSKNNHTKCDEKKCLKHVTLQKNCLQVPKMVTPPPIKK